MSYNYNDLFKGSRDANGRWTGWHERWCRNMLSPEEVAELATVASEGAHGEVLTWVGDVEYTKWPSGETTSVTKKWYLENYYEREKHMKYSQALEAIAGFCVDIREILASANFSDEEGISDMLRDIRIRLDNIEGKAAELRDGHSENKTEARSVFKEGDVVRYRGILCRVEAVIDRNSGNRPWIWYDLREQYGDGEYLDVPESAIVKTSESGAKKAKKTFQRFFPITSCDGDDVWINLFRICYVIGKEVTMVDGKTFALTPDETEDLVAVIGCKNARGTDHDA